MTIRVGDLVRIIDGPPCVGVVLHVFEKYDAPYDSGAGLEQMAKVMWSDFQSIIDIAKVEVIQSDEAG